MVLKGHGFSASGAVPSAQTWNRASAPAPFSHFRKSTSAAEAEFQAGFNGTATLR